MTYLVTLVKYTLILSSCVLAGILHYAEWIELKFWDLCLLWFSFPSPFPKIQRSTLKIYCVRQQRAGV